MNKNRIRELREKNKYSQAQLAEKFGISQPTVSGWEKGQHEIDSKTLSQLADLFYVSTDYLLGRTDNALPPPSQSGHSYLNDIHFRFMNAIRGLPPGDAEKLLSIVEFHVRINSDTQENR